MRTSGTQRYRVRIAALAMIATAVGAPVAVAQDFQTQPLPELVAEAPNLPPLGLYILAGRLFSAGQRDEAVTWFYVAQIRARFRLAAEPNLPPDGEPAVYASLNDMLGRPINEWAFGDIDQAAAEIQAALDWDASHANAETPKAAHAADLESIRKGLVAMRANALADKDNIRRERLANGLVNR